MISYEVFSGHDFRVEPRPQVGIVGAFCDTVAPAGDELKLVLGELQRLWNVRTERDLPRSPTAWSAAREFLKHALVRDYVATPDIFPLDDGAILLEWKEPNSYTVQFELRPDGTAELSGYDYIGREFDIGVLPGIYLAQPYIYAGVQIR